VAFGLLQIDAVSLGEAMGNNRLSRRRFVAPQRNYPLTVDQSWFFEIGAGIQVRHCCSPLSPESLAYSNIIFNYYHIRSYTISSELTLFGNLECLYKIRVHGTSALLLLRLLPFLQMRI
jgi:hypothetical protein